MLEWTWLMCYQIRNVKVCGVWFATCNSWEVIGMILMTQMTNDINTNYNKLEVNEI